MARSRAFDLQLDAPSLAYLRSAQVVYGKTLVTEAMMRFFARQASKTAGAIRKRTLATLRRSGKLAGSIEGVAELIHGGIPAMRVGVLQGEELAYAATQEYGTKGKNPDSPIPTIKPRRAKALTIPVGRGGGKRSLTEAGVGRSVSAKDDPRDLTFIPFHNGGRIIGGLYETKSLQQLRNRQKRSRKQRRVGFHTRSQRLDLRSAKLAWLLATEVDIEPKHYLRDGFAAELQSITDNMGTFLADLFAMRASRAELRGLIKETT